MADYTDIEVASKADFIRFLGFLRQDYERNGKKWENNTMSSFFEAMARWAQDSENYYANMNLDVDHRKASWRVFADIISAAVVYE